MLSSKFVKDKKILLMSLILGLLAAFNILSVLLRTDTAQSSTILRYWIVQGAPEFERQGPEQLYGFAIFAVISFILAIYISYKLHDIYKPAAYVFLGMSQMLILFNIVVGGAILNLQQ